MKTTVVVIALDQPCTVLLRLEQSSLSGESVNTASLDQLNNYNAVFRINRLGEIDSNIQFQSGDEQWSRNVKRAIISAFQGKALSLLRSSDDDESSKSAVVYETDVLGRCRTTYSLSSFQSESSFTLEKSKSLHRCTLNNNQKNSAIQFVPYQSLPVNIKNSCTNN